jgi:hypothetical protein
MGKPIVTGDLKPYVGPFTHSRIRDFETCKLMFNLRHVQRLEGSTSPALARGSAIHEAIECYLNGWVKKLDDAVEGLRKEITALKKLNPICESLWAHDKDYKPLPDSFDKKAWCRAKLDALVKPKPKAPPIVRVFDWKTGKIYPENEDQTIFYGMLALMKAPEAEEASLELWYVDQDLIKLQTPVKRKDIAGVQKDFNKRAGRMYAANKFPAEPGMHCRMCSFSNKKGGPCPSA